MNATTVSKLAATRARITFLFLMEELLPKNGARGGVTPYRTRAHSLSALFPTGSRKRICRAAIGRYAIGRTHLVVRAKRKWTPTEADALAICKALEKAGVEFTYGKGPGVSP